MISSKDFTPVGQSSQSPNQEQVGNSDSLGFDDFLVNSKQYFNQVTLLVSRFESSIQYICSQIRKMVLEMMFLSCIFQLLSTSYAASHSVKVYQYLTFRWGELVSGVQECGAVHCDWTVSDQMDVLSSKLKNFQQIQKSHEDLPPTTTVSLYNIHSWYDLTKNIKPDTCNLNTDFTLAESEESRTRYGSFFDQTFPYFDGFSTTNPAANIQRIYKIARNYTIDDLKPTVSHKKLIKAGVYVAGSVVSVMFCSLVCLCNPYIMIIMFDKMHHN